MSSAVATRPVPGISPLAGRPAPKEMLIDVARLERECFEWLELLDVLTEPAALIEGALAEVDRIQRCGMRQPRKTAVVGTNKLGLLATLALRLRGAEVVTLGRTVEPLLSPNRVKGMAGWKHVWMSPVLARIQLAEETGARYISTSELSLEEAAHRFGPFDVVMVDSADSFPMPSLTRGLAEKGALVDLTLGSGEMEMWTATPAPSFLVKRRFTLQVGGDDRVYTEQATRSLGLAEVLYPGWLARLLETFEAPRAASEKKDPNSEFTKSSVSSRR
jgi:glucose 1-dehydrogenase